MNLLVALAPAVFLKHLSESTMINAANNTWFEDIAVGMDYLEFDGPNTGNLLSDYMWDNYPLFCYAESSLCDFEILTV